MNWNQKMIRNQKLNWNQTIKLSKTNRNTVLYCLKENKYVEKHKNIGTNKIVKGSIFIS